MKTKSQFATVLALLIDGSGLCARKQWAEILGISEAAISQWLNDKTLPSPEFLRVIVSTIRRNSNRVPHWILVEFDNVASKPAIEVSPFAERLGRSVNDYLLKPLRDGFWEVFESLSVESQEQLLPTFSEMCMREAGVFSDENVENTDVLSDHNDTEHGRCVADGDGALLNAHFRSLQDGCICAAPFYGGGEMKTPHRSALRQSAENAFTEVLRKALTIGKGRSLETSFTGLRHFLREERRAATNFSLKLLLSWFKVSLESALAVNNHVHQYRHNSLTYTFAENAARFGSDPQLTCSLYESCMEEGDYDVVSSFNFVNACALANNKERAEYAWGQFAARLEEHRSEPAVFRIFDCRASWPKVYKRTLVLCGDFRALSTGDLETLDELFDGDAAFSAVSKGEIRLLEREAYNIQSTLARWSDNGLSDFIVSDTFKNKSASVFVYGPMQDLLQMPGVPLVRVAVSLVNLGTQPEHAWRIAHRLEGTQTLIFVHFKNVLSNSALTDLKEKLPYGFSVIDLINGSLGETEFQTEAARAMGAGI